MTHSVMAAFAPRRSAAAPHSVVHVAGVDFFATWKAPHRHPAPPRISVHMAMLAAVHLVVAFLVPPPGLVAPPGASRRAVLRMNEPPSGEVKIVSDDTYKLMMKALLDTEKSIADEVSNNYAMFDYEFMQRLETSISSAEGAEAERLLEVRSAVNAEMGKRMATAAETLKEVLTSPSAVVMEGRMAGLARQGKVDDALLQLLQANLEQARAAGEQGKGAVALMERLQARVQQELDTKLTPDAVLLRQLLRIESKPARLALLKEKMQAKAKSSILLSTDVEASPTQDETQDTEPEVDPRKLAEAIKNLKMRFGNMDENYDSGFVKKVEMIADEAEGVALDLAGGKEVTAKQQQDMMWNDGERHLAKIPPSPPRVASRRARPHAFFTPLPHRVQLR